MPTVFSHAELFDTSFCIVADAPKDPSTDDGYWVHTLKTIFEELEALGLSKPIPKSESKKRGRKPKTKDQSVLKPKRPEVAREKMLTSLIELYSLAD